METLTLRYWDGGTVYTRNLSALSVRGYDEPDEFRIVGTQARCKDGSIEETIQGILRYVTVDMVLTSRDDRNFLFEFLYRNNREAYYQNGVMFSMLENPAEYSNEWLRNFHQSKRYILRLIDARPQYNFGRTVQEGELAYIKRHVKIEGTKAFPETFTTNVGKLLTDQRGIAYPVFSDATHVYTVLVNPKYQEAKAFLVTEPSIVSGNITFQVAVDEVGEASGDGFYYADITIILSAKP